MVKPPLFADLPEFETVPLIETSELVKDATETDEELSSEAALNLAGDAWDAPVTVIVPLFVIVFQTTDDLAVAMEARCYRGGEGRSRMKPFAWRFADTAALVFCFALVVGQKLLNWYVG